jgi:hypothetical protein
LLPEQGHLAAASLSLHSTRAGKARLLKSVLREALRLGFPLPLEHAEVPIDPSACFSRFLTHEARTRSFPQLAVLAGNPRRLGRRFVLLLFGEHGRPACVVKAGVGSAAMELVEWERAFLGSAPSPVDWMPRVFAQFRDDGACAFSMEFVEGDMPGVVAEGIVDTTRERVGPQGSPAHGG